jgi:hypothetical protein
MLAILRIVLGAAFILVAGFMLVAPRTWYETVPGVAERGAFNPHFVRDIACAVLITGGAFVAAGIWGERWRPAMIAGAAFGALHALVHLGEEMGAHSHSFFWTDLPAVYLPTLLSLWLAFARSPQSLRCSAAACGADQPTMGGIK